MENDIHVLISNEEKLLCEPGPNLISWSQSTREERREKREKMETVKKEKKTLCVTKPHFLVLVHTRISLKRITKFLIKNLKINL
jgi:hypothetical protein